MKKIHEKQKKWIRKKSNKEIRRRQKKNRSRERANKSGRSFENNRRSNIKRLFDYAVAAPKGFDFSDNIADTLSFFNDVKEKIFKAKMHCKIFFDLSKVVDVSADAIMYLIAIIRNTKKIDTFDIHCIGNAPQYIGAKEKFINSGFYDYVSSKVRTDKVYRDHIKIKNGKNADPHLAQEICEFIHDTSKYTILDTKFLFSMIIELMTNSKQHAYTSITNMGNNWYIFTEDRGTYYKFIFLDTGLGIPNTLRVNFKEKISSMFINNDAHLMASALLGDFRTETNLEYRGKGLPEIFERIKTSKIYGFSIVSGHGRCVIKDDHSIEEQKMPHAFSGTLMSWNLSK